MTKDNSDDGLVADISYTLMGRYPDIKYNTEYDRKGVKTPHYVSRHPYKNEFEKRYGTESDLLIATNNIIDNY